MADRDAHRFFTCDAIRLATEASTVAEKHMVWRSDGIPVRSA
jgi:hypothetical protein